MEQKARGILAVIQAVHHNATTDSKEFYAVWSFLLDLQRSISLAVTDLSCVDCDCLESCFSTCNGLQIL